MKKTALERDLVFVDIETSGFSPETQEILEIACIRTTSDAREITGSFECLVLPEHIETASPEALIINGYQEGEWAFDGVSLDTALEKFLNICFGGVTLVAHSATFDWGFLRAALTRKSLLADLDYHIICTASLSWPLVMRGEVVSPKLEALCTHFGISNEGQYSAMRDVERMLAVYRRLVPVPAVAGISPKLDVNSDYGKQGFRGGGYEILADGSERILPGVQTEYRSAYPNIELEAPEIPVKPDDKRRI